VTVYRWVEHTGELELAIEAPSAEAVLADALAAYRELLGPALGKRATHEVDVEAPDRPALLAAWLEELVFLAETEAFVPERAELELRADGLRARVEGRRGEPSHIVKAVTYHDLEFSPADDGWRARVVLDV